MVYGNIIQEKGVLVPFKFSSDNLTIKEMVIELKFKGFDIDEQLSLEYESIEGNDIVVVDGIVYVMEYREKINLNDGYTVLTDNGDGTYNYNTTYIDSYSFLEEQLYDAMRNTKQNIKIKPWEMPRGMTGEFV